MKRVQFQFDENSRVPLSELEKRGVEYAVALDNGGFYVPSKRDGSAPIVKPIEHQIQVQLKILRPKENEVVIVEYPPGSDDALREIRRCVIDIRDQLPDTVQFVLLPAPYTMQAVDSRLVAVNNDMKRQFQKEMREFEWQLSQAIAGGFIPTVTAEPAGNLPDLLDCRGILKTQSGE